MLGPGATVATGTDLGVPADGSMGVVPERVDKDGANVLCAGEIAGAARGPPPATESLRVGGEEVVRLASGSRGFTDTCAAADASEATGEELLSSGVASAAGAAVVVVVVVAVVAAVAATTSG